MNPTNPIPMRTIRTPFIYPSASVGKRPIARAKEAVSEPSLVDSIFELLQSGMYGGRQLSKRLGVPYRKIMIILDVVQEAQKYLEPSILVMHHGRGRGYHLWKKES